MLSRSASNWLKTERDGRPVVRAPWQVAVFGAAVALSVVTAGAVVLGGLAGTGIETLARAARIPLDQVATVAALMVATVLSTRITRPGDSAAAVAGLGAGAWRPIPIAGAYLIGTMVVSVPVGLMLWGGVVGMDHSPWTESWWSAAFGALAILVPASLTEELLFRGVAYTAIEEAAGRRAAIGLTSIGFGLVHLANPGATVASVVGVIVAGAFLGIVRGVTRSVAAAWAAHLAINVTQALCFHASLSGVDLPAPGYRLVSRGPAWLTGGAWGPEGGLAVVAALTAASFLLTKAEGRRQNTT